MNKSANFRISRNTLEIIAIITMIIDHIGTTFNRSFLRFFTMTGMTSENLIRHAHFVDLLYGIGRIAFPIFAFLIADGCLHTRNIKKYAFRLGIVAVISEIFYDYAGDETVYFIGPMKNFNDFLSHFKAVHNQNNVIFSLFASVLFIIAIQNFQKKIKDKFSAFQVVKLAVIFVLLYGALTIFGAEYSEIAIPMIALLYVCKKKSSKIIVLSVFLAIFYIIYPTFQPLLSGDSLQQAISTSMFAHFDISNVFMVAGVVISIILIAFYRYDPEHKPRNSRLIYLVYPVHLFILGLIRDIYVTFMG